MTRDPIKGGQGREPEDLLDAAVPCAIAVVGVLAVLAYLFWSLI